MGLSIILCFTSQQVSSQDVCGGVVVLVAVAGVCRV